MYLSQFNLRLIRLYVHSRADDHIFAEKAQRYFDIPQAVFYHRRNGIAHHN